MTRHEADFREVLDDFAVSLDQNILASFAGVEGLEELYCEKVKDIPEEDGPGLASGQAVVLNQLED